MGMIENKELVLKPIIDLFKYEFYIPAYQRGYRWTDTQVNQLLDDIWNFTKNPPKTEIGTESPFYCLQPIVVNVDESDNNRVEVIDGQQRLTTIYLIIKHLKNQIERKQKNFAKICYETRSETEYCIGSEKFLDNIEQFKDESNKNIDFFHMYQAYETIENWFEYKANNSDDAAPRAVFAPALLSKTKVIWYEIKKTKKDLKKYNLIDIFTRLNTGKIPLTNSELIKALFLKKDNFEETSATLKQIQIAFEWNIVEKKLQNNSFWYFIYNPDNPIKYENRIEYIFDLIKSRKKSSEYYYTFNKYLDEFSTNVKNGKPDIDFLWLEIKNYFLLLDEWFTDYYLYHYVGFLITCGIPISKIKKDYLAMKKDEFKDYIKSEIRDIIKCDINNLSFENKKDKKKIKMILLLFNVQTVLQTQKSDMRFPFNKYKSEAWDIEHVCSQTDKEINKENRLKWINDILEYFAGESNVYKVRRYINDISLDLNNNSLKKEETTEIIHICNALITFKESEKIDDNKFNEMFLLVQEFFGENKETDDKDSLSNLALLDSVTNRSYGNSFFPIKRIRIIENDSVGIFVPIATKNLFLKYYSKKLGNLMYWNKEDANDYMSAITCTLKDFL